jgi:hypothetical protein
MKILHLYEEISCIQFALETNQLDRAKWHVNDLLKRLKKELPKEAA